MTEKKGIPLSVVISPASTHDIKLVTDVVDKAVIKRRRGRRSWSKRQLRQHLCLDKGYNSTEEEQKLIKRGYILHIPIKKKKKKKREERKIMNKNQKQYPIVRDTPLRDGL